MSAGGGLFGVERIQWFNGGLFDGADVLPVETADIDVVRTVARLDWAEIEPAIFGTLFERGLDPDRRTQLGAHYTDRSAIDRLVDPVLMEPLRHDFEATKARIEELLAAGKKTSGRTRPDQDPKRVFAAFLERLRSVRVLDPACGSGNFLYIALQKLKDLEREAILWGSLTLRIPQEFPQIGPEAVLGIDVNLYAAELARVTIWIGEIQWMLRYGFSYRTNPILSPLDNIRTMDALLDWSDPGAPREADWPSADVVIGNPPFLGAKLLRRSLGSEYVEVLFKIFGDRLPGMSDFVCYWHEKARAMVADGRAKRVGLLATQGIRGGASRRVIERIKQTGDIFLAWSDEPWVLDGAAVHVSFLGYDDGSDKTRTLNGRVVASINANLTAGADLTKARRLKENLGIAFVADVKGGRFDIPESLALDMLGKSNPHAKSNRDVIRPWVNGLDITRRRRDMWITDFGVRMSREEAALYQAPFEYVKTHVKPFRDSVRRTSYRERWWLHVEPGSGMRQALAGLERYIVTPTLTKHRVFAWLDADTLADHQLIAIARDDDYTFGVLQSRPHELWARAMGTQLREVESGFRYTPTTTFETFPFPHPTPEQRDAIAEAARTLNDHRDAWLNPPAATGKELLQRTLTNLYNERPTWLIDDHDRLDRAVLAAYDWSDDISDENILAGLLALNLAREPPGQSLAEQPRHRSEQDSTD